jgi:hypothetical protein
MDGCGGVLRGRFQRPGCIHFKLGPLGQFDRPPGWAESQEDARGRIESRPAIQLKDPELIGFATEIRKRAERRAGELLKETAERGERASRDDAKKSHPATFELPDLGVKKRNPADGRKSLPSRPSIRWKTLSRPDQAGMRRSRSGR